MSMSELLEDINIQSSIINQVVWSKLSQEQRNRFGNNERSWKAAVVKWSLLHQLRWKQSLIRRIVADEKQYYLELCKHSKDNLMLYPYHLSDVLMKGMYGWLGWVGIVLGGGVMTFLNMDSKKDCKSLHFTIIVR